jgi:hypothetical protein
MALTYYHSLRGPAHKTVMARRVRANYTSTCRDS